MRDLNGIYGANQVFVEFDEYVVIFDAGRVNQGRQLDAEIRSRVGKPVRYIVHSHFHPDHTAGAALFAGEDVEILASAADREHFEVWARQDFAHKVEDSPEMYRNLHYPAPTRYLEETEVFDDGQQRLEVIHLGHAHTKGDLVGWLPDHGILLSGDVCENREYPNFANSNVAGWIEVLDQLRSLPIEKVVPGHGHLGGPEVIEMFYRFLVELKRQVNDMVARGMTFQEVLPAVHIPFFEEWTGTAVRDARQSVAVAFREAGGVHTPSTFTKKQLTALGLIFVTALAVAGGLYLRKRSKTRGGGIPSEAKTDAASLTYSPKRILHAAGVLTRVGGRRRGRDPAAVKSAPVLGATIDHDKRRVKAADS